MAAILFTDADGSWKLHNAKPHPAGRFRNWTPDGSPFGDAASRLSDGAITMFRFRNDFGASFELPHIPSKRSTNLALRSEDLGTAPWTTSGTPTRSAAAHTASGILLDLIGDDTGAAVEEFSQPINFAGDSGDKGVSCYVKVGTSPAAGGSELIIADTTAGANRLRAVLTFSAGVPVVTVTTGTRFDPELYNDGVYRIRLAAVGVLAANTNSFIVRPALTSTEQGNLYFGGLHIDHSGTSGPGNYLYTTSAAKTNVSQLDIASRLRRHLLNGGTCTLYLTDAAGTSYATCGLKPGTTPEIALADRRTLEYTLSLSLINLAGSPSEMSAYYAEQ